MGTRQKAQVLEGRGIQGHFEIQSLRNAISTGLQEVLPCCFVRLRLGTMMSKCPRHSTTLHGSNVSHLFKYAFNVIQNWEADALPFYWMVLIFC